MSRPVSDIIDQARAAPAPRRGALFVSVVTAGLLWLAYFPIDFGPLAWVALVPWLLLARVTVPTRWMYLSVFLGGGFFWVPTLQWMRLGDPAMVPAWLALAFYLAMYFPVGLAFIRLAVGRWNLPLAVAAPVVWVGLEFLRAHLMTGFAWYLIGHSQHDFTTLLQISDLFGAYGVSFVVVLAAAALAETVPASGFARLRLVPPVCQLDQAVRIGSSRRRLLSVLASLLLTSASLGYGWYRTRDAEFPTGPRVGLIQGDFRSDVKHDVASAAALYEVHTTLTGMTVPYRPDVIVWPETMVPWALHLADPTLSRDELASQFPNVPPEVWTHPRADIATELRDKSEMAGAKLIVGALAKVASPSGPATYNSALFVEPQIGLTGRYDKIHRVPFGEYIPLRETLPFLSAFSPYSTNFGIQAGTKASVFRAGTYRLLPLICFEDTVPQLVRSMVSAASQPTADGEKQTVDCLVNLTNDGWFRSSSEQEQHLITAAFRCIETRTPMVRAVNTGISAVIDGNGEVREPLKFIDGDSIAQRIMDGDDPNRSSARVRDWATPVRTTLHDPHTGRYHKSMAAALIADIPLDPRESLYTWWGDWFAASCLGLTLAAAAWAAARPSMKTADLSPTATASALPSTESA
ncbi:MAG: apolipoprotein N-acyltransferase [Planctomycetaceae bacterium]